MASKNRIEGAEAILAFIHDTKLAFGNGQDARADLYVSAKAGDKWRSTRVALPVDFKCNENTPEVFIEALGRPFYRGYHPRAGTAFLYDPITSKLFIEGHLNKGRGDPYVICISR